MCPSKPSKRWTALAGLVFFWNVSTGHTGLPPVTELARKHRVVTVALLLALYYHLAPWRSPGEQMVGAAGPPGLSARLAPEGQLPE